MGLRGRNSLTNESVFFVTTTARNFIPAFEDHTNCDILVNNIKHYQMRYKFVVLAYVIMPSHFHWIVLVEPKEGTISDIMRDLKKYSAWDIMENIECTKSIGMENFVRTNKPRQKRQFWEHRFHDSVIRNQRMFWSKVIYIHNNPVKAGLVEKPEDYKYSSARNYLLNDHSTLFVDTKFGGVDIR